jgi:hypothetical protein
MMPRLSQLFTLSRSMPMTWANSEELTSVSGANVSGRFGIGPDEATG